VGLSWRAADVARRVTERCRWGPKAAPCSPAVAAAVPAVKAACQLQHGTVAVGQPPGRLRDQVGQFGAGGQRVRTRIAGYGFGQLVGDLFPATVLDPAQRFIARDRIQPRAQFVGLAQPRQTGRGGAERVLQAVGGSVGIAQHAHAEVVRRSA
jgi:hypothetical protein